MCTCALVCHHGCVSRTGILANPVFRRLFFAAQVVALGGTGLLTVALSLLAYDLAGPAAGAVLGTVLAIKMLAYVFIAPVMATVTNRLPRKAVLIGADLTRAAVALSLPFVGQVWQIYVLVFVLQAASATFTPAFQAAIPAILHRRAGVHPGIVTVPAGMRPGGDGQPDAGGRTARGDVLQQPVRRNRSRIHRFGGAGARGGVLDIEPDRAPAVRRVASRACENAGAP